MSGLPSIFDATAVAEMSTARMEPRRSRARLFRIGSLGLFDGRFDPPSSTFEELASFAIVDSDHEEETKAMYLRSRLLHYMRSASIMQKDVADRWLARAEFGETQPRRATVVSQLSRLVRREEAGAARFFFRTRAFGKALFDSIGVPDWERDELFAAAEALARAPSRKP